MDYCPRCFKQVTYIEDVCGYCGGKIVHVKIPFLSKVMEKLMRV
jgi:rRNA maturation endonuclease Nob1